VHRFRLSLPNPKAEPPQGHGPKSNCRRCAKMRVDAADLEELRWLRHYLIFH
jgi:hypothetical protein